MVTSEQPLLRLPGFNEPFSAISHLLGAGVFLFLGCLLLWRGRRNPSGMPFLMIYAFSLVLLLTISGMFHMPPRGSPRHHVIERLDHSAIFLLIAGTFTPAHGILFHGWLRWGPLALIWTGATAGILLKVFYFEQLPELLGLMIYLTLGWTGAFSGILLARRYGIQFIKPLLYGGIAYSIGAVIEYNQWLVIVPGIILSHEVFHIAVLMGAFWHWLFIWQFAPGEAFVQSQRRADSWPAVETAEARG